MFLVHHKVAASEKFAMLTEGQWRSFFFVSFGVFQTCMIGMCKKRELTFAVCRQRSDLLLAIASVYVLIH